MSGTGDDPVDVMRIQGHIVLDDMPIAIANKLHGILFAARHCPLLASISAHSVTANGKMGITFYGKIDDLNTLIIFLEILLPVLKAHPAIVQSNFPESEAWEQ